MSYLHWLRSRVGHRKIFLAYASVILKDKQGAVLLQRRTDFNFWGLPGGVLELGEDLPTCARRELREETGLVAGPLRLVGLYTDPRYDLIYPNGDQVQQFTACFEGTLAGGAMQPDGVETSSQQFFRPQELPWEELPCHYADMLRDSLRGGEPAFEQPAAAPVTTPQIETLRALVGHDQIVAVGASTVIVREDGRILMQLRDDDGGWDFPGGYMELGENVAYTALREAREETGLEVVLERLLGIQSPVTPWVYPNGDSVQPVAAFFLARPAGGQLSTAGGETNALIWMSPAEIEHLSGVPLFLTLKQAVITHLDHGVFIV
jgi:ADP-ribose pyrophosphatase YjhB (NUDIX family)